MNLNNNQITVKELLSNPKAKAIFQKEIPQIINHPKLNLVANLKLSEILVYAKGYLPQYKIDSILRQLEEV